MNTVVELELELSALRAKWKKWPRSWLDPHYADFRVDKVKAERIKTQIAILKRNDQDRPLNVSETEAVAQMIFGEET